MAADGSYIPRYVDRALDLLLAELPAMMLTGPRGCGKTTTALRRAAAVMRLDRPDEAGAFRASPDAVLAAQPMPVLIDEWQVVPESMGAVKRAVDAGSGAGRFLLTGSVRARLDSAGWPGTGRIVPLAMYGLTVGELQHRHQAAAAIERLFSDEDPPVGVLKPAPSLVDYLDHAIRGGFPDAVGLSDFSRSTWYEGYADQLVRHDVSDLAEVRSPAGLAALLRAVALNTAGLPSLTTLADAARIDHRTARTYLDLLEDLRIIERIPAWTTNRLSRLVKSPKYYILDPGLAAHLAGDTRTGMLKSGDRIGRLVDTFVLAQLRPLFKLATPAVTAHHLRDDNQTREVDLVLESASGRIVGIEVKAASTVDPRDARHLAWLRDHLGTTFQRGIVLHAGATTYPLGERMWAVPIAALWQ
jgi:predicted AAA+ superfamily ATPase